MAAPPTIWQVELTGETRHRPAMFGKMVLQVQEIRRSVRLVSPEHREVSAGGITTWRDARWEDLDALTRKRTA